MGEERLSYPSSSVLPKKRRDGRTSDSTEEPLKYVETINVKREQRVKKMRSRLSELSCRLSRAKLQELIPGIKIHFL